ncbi:MAG TPA: hypothetical protein VJQ59_04140 [Candidatus Sulfotelmatobacter sp.]|nr:hypothetical protein [Candidatus Sulfotelmatobacter sp.]
MRQHLIQFGSLLLLTLCIWGHVSELFDHWDNTFHTGYDVEYNTVIVVLAAGAVIAFARVLAHLIPTHSATDFRFAASTIYAPVATDCSDFIGHSPPLSLRI